MKPKLTEKDLEQIFIASRKRKDFSIKQGAKFVSLFILIALSLYFILNFSAFSSKISFWYKDQFGSPETLQLQKAVREALNPSTSNSDPLPNISDNSIYIEAINLKAPITFRVTNDEQSVSRELKNGLIQLAGTSLPGENGNVFVTGHSSNYPWVKSQYNSVFSLLDNVVVGDLIQLKFRDKNYIYRVTERFVTDPSNSDVLNKYKNSPTLTLMTCSPVGTNLKRLIIRSDQIIPDPSTANPSSAVQQKSLPAVNR